MRHVATAVCVSWLPIESLDGVLRPELERGLGHYDPPPPDTINGLPHLLGLRDADRFRFAQLLTGWVDVDAGRITGWGWGEDAGSLMGATTVRVNQAGATFPALGLPVLRPEPEVGPTSVRFQQTAGGRAGVPLPRPVPHPPFLQWRAPVVWTTLSLTVDVSGRAEVALVGASSFPRHWVYDADGHLAAKTGVTDPKSWLAHSFGGRTPWGDQDSPVLVAAAETALERQVSARIMQEHRHPKIRRLDAGAVLTRQGDHDTQLYLLLDGILAVDVDGEVVAELGPGAVLGERALLEGGRRASTVVATTPVRVAVAGADVIDLPKLRELARQHGWQGGAGRG
jgi:hypothetical protein